MREKFYLKNEAISLRQNGFSYSEIEKMLHVPRSTLSGWFSGLILRVQAKKEILNRKKNNLAKAREKAVQSHIQKNLEERVEKTIQVQNFFEEITWTKEIQEALLALLYLGEGSKKSSFIGLGNSNSRIVQMFVYFLRSIYTIDERKFRCYLYLRYDQNEQKEKKFWSNVTNIPISQFRKAQFDKRTLGKKTWIGYHGVCVVNYYDAKVEKRLTAWQNLLLDKFS